MSLRTATQSLGAAKARALFLAACGVLVGGGIAGAWFIATNRTVDAQSIDLLLRFLLTKWMLLTYAVTGAFVLFGWWYLRSMREPDRTLAFDARIVRDGRLLVLVLVFFAASLSGVGYLFVDDLRASFKEERLAQQLSIARLKADQVDKWLLEHWKDAQSLALSLQSLPIQDLSSDRETRQVVNLLFAQLLAGNSERVAIALLARDGTLLAYAGDEEATADIAPKAIAATNGRSTQIGIVDVQEKSTSSRALEMAFVLPLGPGGTAGPADAVVAIIVDPSLRLFREIVAWPAESASSEALLVRRSGDDMVLLTPPRLLDGAPPAPLSYRLPMARLGLPAVQSILDGNGFHEGIDYRGVEVLAAYRAVVGVPWGVVAKTDVDELMLPIQKKIRAVSVVVAGVIAVATFMVVVLWRGQRAGYLAYRDLQVVERAAMSRHFEEVIRLARDIVFLVDSRGFVLEANEAAVAAYGYSAEEFHRLNVRSLRSPETVATFEADWNAGTRPGGLLVETVHQRKDGSTFPVELSTRAFEVDGKTFRQSFIRDISVRKDLENELKRLGRLQKTLYEATTILLRAKTECELFQGMCNAIVAQGGYLVASIALANHDADRTVRFATVAGEDDGFLATAKISWGEGPYSTGPTGAAIKTGEIQVDQDFSTNPAVAAWRDGALKVGAHAGIGLPLRTSGVVFGALTIYSTKANDFNAEEVALLTRFADDISYGVTAMRSRVAAPSDMTVD